MRASLLSAMVAVMISTGCKRARSPGGDLPPSAQQSGALRLIERSEPYRPLLVSELSDTDRETWFRISNGGESEINVKVASKSCSCVDLLADEKPLAVGDGFAMAVGERKKIRLVGRVAPIASIQGFGASLVACDGSSVTLEGSQTVYADVDCIPSLLIAPMRREGGDVDQSVEVVHTFRSGAARPVALDPPRGVTVVSVSPQGEPRELEPGVWQQTWTANVKMTPAAIAQGLATLRFAFGKSSVSVPIKITQAFGIAVPDKVVFGSVGVGTHRKRRLVMHSADGIPFKIIKADTDSQEVGVSVKESRSPSRYWIDLDFQPTEAGERHATISIETTYPDSPRLAISAVGRGHNHE